MEEKIARKDITRVLIEALEPLDYVHALWEAGAAAFKRVDEWSDIDLYVVVDDDGVEDTISSMEKALSVLSEFDLTLRLPEPTWHGHSQVFWRLKKASPFLFLDIVIMKRSSKNKFLQFTIHGEPLIHFDKTGVIKDDSIHSGSFVKRLETRLEMIKTTFALFQVLTLKELNRGNDIEAFSYYVGYTYRPLVEVLRIKYCPYHYNFFTTYIYYELPPEIVARLQKLYFVAHAEQLRQCQAEAEEWFWEVVKSINLDEVKRRLADKNA